MAREGSTVWRAAQSAPARIRSRRTRTLAPADPGPDRTGPARSRARNSRALGAPQRSCSGLSGGVRSLAPSAHAVGRTSRSSSALRRMADRSRSVSGRAARGLCTRGGSGQARCSARRKGGRDRRASAGRHGGRRTSGASGRHKDGRASTRGHRSVDRLTIEEVRASPYGGRLKAMDQGLLCEDRQLGSHQWLAVVRARPDRFSAPTQQLKDYQRLPRVLPQSPRHILRCKLGRLHCRLLFTPDLTGAPAMTYTQTPPKPHFSCDTRGDTPPSNRPPSTPHTHPVTP